MKINIIPILSLGLLLLFATSARAQEKNFYRMDRLKTDNPWILSHNAAGLTTGAVSRFSIVEANWQYNTGDFRNVSDPTDRNRMNLLTESLLRLNKVYFYGKFSFDYDIRRNKAWSSVLDPYYSSIYMADSIPGEQTLEVYRLDGGVGYPLGKHFAIGAKVAYETASNAKHKDARNENTYMNLQVYPGVLFQTGPVRIGLNMIYQKMTEMVDIKIIGTGKIHEIFQFEGLWHYKSTIIAEGASLQSNHQEKLYGGSLQLELFNDKISFFNELSITQRKQEAFPSDFTNERSGKIKERKYTYTGLLHKKGKSYDHYLSLRLDIANKLGFENIQQSEVIDQNEEWIQYGTKNKTSVEITQADIYYQLFRNRTAYNSSWDARIGAKGLHVKRIYRLYPARFVQKIENYEGYLSLNKNFLFQKGMFDCGLNLAYTFGDGTLLDTEKEGKGEIPDAQQYKRKDDLLQQEYAFFTSDRFLGGLNIRYTRFLNKEKGMSLYGNVKTFYCRSLNGWYKGEGRTNLQVTLGFAF